MILLQLKKATTAMSMTTRLISTESKLFVWFGRFAQTSRGTRWWTLTWGAPRSVSSQIRHGEDPLDKDTAESLGIQRKTGCERESGHPLQLSPGQEDCLARRMQRLWASSSSTPSEGNHLMEDISSSVKMVNGNKGGSMAEKIRNKLGVKVRTYRPPTQEIPSEEAAKVNQLVEGYLETVFTDQVGCLKIKPVDLDFYPKFKPIQPPYRHDSLSLQLLSPRSQSQGNFA